MTTRFTSVRVWSGPVFLALSPLVFFAGDAILRVHHARPFNIVGALGFLLVVGSVLVFTAGLGEFGNWLTARFSRNS